MKNCLLKIAILNLTQINVGIVLWIIYTDVREKSLLFRRFWNMVIHN